MNLPITPDFQVWTKAPAMTELQVVDGALMMAWADGKVAHFAPLMLAENDPAADVLHSKSREMLISPLDLPADLLVQSADRDLNGTIVIQWSHERRASHFHPDWLRGVAWFDDDVQDLAPTSRISWNATEMPVPPTFDGPTVLNDVGAELAWLEALAQYGIARLENLPQQDGLLEQIVTQIGPVRDSNFGRQYTLEIKDDPDSNAFTSDALLQHIDMPTRESPHGLQFLYCRANTTTGGEGVYCDGIKILEDMRVEQPDAFTSLCQDVWTFNNRAKSSDYRAKGPIAELNEVGQVTGIRFTPWLRAPLKAPLSVQRRAYAAVRTLITYAQDDKYRLAFRYRPGDLLAFDNRRVLHGRAGYDAHGGTRFIEGIYSDRDDLFSRIRVLQKEQSHD